MRPATAKNKTNVWNNFSAHFWPTKSCTNNHINTTHLTLSLLTIWVGIRSKILSILTNKLRQVKLAINEPIQENFSILKFINLLTRHKIIPASSAPYIPMSCEDRKID